VAHGVWRVTCSPFAEAAGATHPKTIMLTLLHVAAASAPPLGLDGDAAAAADDDDDADDDDGDDEAAADGDALG
jgi:hypothetical protein